MLLRYLFSRHDRDGADADGAFRLRGAGVSRLEGLSDTVFGFAITLLVISTTAPATAMELLALQHRLLPFVASFTVLFIVWRAQFDFFRRFGLEDRRTVMLTGVLLMIVLLAIYPLRFLSGFLLDTLPTALLAHDESMKLIMPMDMFPRVVLLYALGLGGVSAVFALLYRHAAQLRVSLAMGELELFDTRSLQRRFGGMAVLSGAIALWCIGMLVLGADHTRARDKSWALGYASLYLIAGIFGVVRAVSRRRGARARAALIGDAISPGATPAAAD